MKSQREMHAISRQDEQSHGSKKINHGDENPERIGDAMAKRRTPKKIKSAAVTMHPPRAITQ